MDGPETTAGAVPPNPVTTAPLDTGTEPYAGSPVASAAGSDAGGREGAAPRAQQAVKDKLPPTAQEQAGEVGDKARKAVAETTTEVKAQARDLLGEARSQLRDRAESSTQQVLPVLRSTSQDLRRMADASDGGTVASDVVGRLASGLEQAAGRVDEGGIDAVVRDVQDYARRNPGKFLLGALAAGFAVGRIVQHADTTALKQAMRDGMAGDDGRGQGSLASSYPTGAGLTGGTVGTGGLGGLSSPGTGTGGLTGGTIGTSGLTPPSTGTTAYPSGHEAAS